MTWLRERVHASRYVDAVHRSATLDLGVRRQVHLWASDSVQWRQGLLRVELPRYTQSSQRFLCVSVKLGERGLLLHVYPRRRP